MDGTPARRVKPRPLFGALDDWARRKKITSCDAPPRRAKRTGTSHSPSPRRGRTTPSTRSSGSDCSSEYSDRDSAKRAPACEAQASTAGEAVLPVPASTALVPISPAHAGCKAGALADAVRQHDVVELSWLLNAGADIDELDAHGETPLFRAAASGDAVMVFLLLEGRADPRHRSPAGLTAIDLARDQQVASLIGAMMPSVAQDASQEALDRALRGLPSELSRRCRDLAQVAAAEREAEQEEREAPALQAVTDHDYNGRGPSDFNGCPAFQPGLSGMAWTAPLSRQACHLGAAAYYCDGGGEMEDYIAMEDYIPVDMDDVMEDLLFRDITPEDYEFLLQLDEGIARDTAGEEEVSCLELADPQEAAGEACAVCLLPFEDDATEGSIAILQCRHLFHHECISKWLLERSRFCPLCSEAACPSER